MTALAAGLVALCAALQVAQPPSSPSDADAPIVFVHGVEDGPFRAARELFERRVRKFEGLREEPEVRPLPAVEGGAAGRGLENRLGLELLRALRGSPARAAYALTFDTTLGAVRVYAFDRVRGVEAGRVKKVEDEARAGRDEHDEEGEELPPQFAAAIDEAFAAFARARARCDAPAEAAIDPPEPTGDEDPPEPGFRWNYVAAGARTLAQVTRLFDNGSLAQAGLRAGDFVVAVDGRPTTSPPLFGRAIATLHPGRPLTLQVERGGATVDLSGTVVRASALLPAFEAAAIGRPLPPLGATTAASATAPKATVIVLFDPKRPATLRDLAPLAWLREHHDEAELALRGIAVGANDAELAPFLAELAPGFPAVADPDHRLEEATRTVRYPALLVVDGAGIVRGRPADAVELQRQLRPLLAPK